MKPRQPDSRSIRTYHQAFILIVTGMLLFAMFMTSKQQGLGEFEANFFQRNLLIKNFNRLRIRLGDRVINQVIIGKNGWMEFTRGRNLDDYQNAISLSPEQLQAA